MLIEIYHKDVAPISGITDLSNKEITSVQVGWPTGDESKYNVILSAEANIIFRARGNTITPELFLTDYYDEWKVIIYCDTIIVFVGFVEPSEGNYALKDLPLEVNVKCTDGLGLLKDVPLTDHAGVSFQGTIKTLIEYAAGALAKTELELPIRVICNIYESSMINRSGSASADMFNQAKLEYRTFLKDAVTFTDCYNTLEILFTGGFTVFQWQGKWVISYRPQLMESIGPTDYYTDYNPDASILGSGQDFGTHINVGKTLQQHPVLIDQLVSYQVPDVSVKDTFNYNIWDEIPKNNKFERGTLLVLYSGINYTAFTISDWQYGQFNSGLMTFPFNLTSDQAYRKSSYNAFGIELDRELILISSGAPEKFLLSEGMPVNAQDKIHLTLDFRHTGGSDGFGNKAIFRVYLYAAGTATNPAWLDNLGHWRGGTVGSYFFDYTAGFDSSVYRTFDVTPDSLPFDGTLYIIMLNTSDGFGDHYYRNFNLEYQPFVAGGYVQVNGDYWITSQNQSIKNTIDEEIFISDALEKMVKGSLFRNDGITLTTPTWYRYGISEQRHYKELLNLGKYRHYYRRYKKITGTLRGVRCASENAPLSFYAIGFHKHFKFVDDDDGKLYVASPPMSIDYVTGQVNAVFIECFDKNNSVTGAESNGQIASHLTAATNISQPRSPEVAQRFGVLIRLYVTTAEAATITASASDGGVGNFPSLTLLSNVAAGIGHHNMFWSVGSDVAVGNAFIFHFPWGDVTYVASSVTQYIDDAQNGDSHNFNYIFQ